MMTNQFFNCILLLIVIWNTDARVGFGPGEQDWGYVQVRPNATMFWWLFYTTAGVKSFYEKPLIIWLQGGPGVSSTGYGNFKLIGPLDPDLNPRNHTWVKKYNVLFIDSPVGAGFSHADHKEAFATTNKQDAADLLECIKNIFEKDPKLKKVRSYIVGQSYGGKIGFEFARVWYEAEKTGEIESRLRGIAMGAPFISPIDLVMSWAPYLFNTGIADDEGYKKIETYANKMKAETENENYRSAKDLFRETLIHIINHLDVDLYNIQTKVNYYEGAQVENNFMMSTFFLEPLMNSNLRSKLNLSTHWGSQMADVYATHEDELMKPVVDQVEYVLNNTDLKVCIYNGQLDLIVATPGTWNWVKKLRWSDSEKWLSSVRESFLINNTVEGYVKKYKKFSMYWINRSGHMALLDNPVTVSEIMSNFTDES